MNRRELLKATGLLAAGGMLGAISAPAQTFPKIAARIFDPKDYGALGDGKALDSVAINHAIEACCAQGGGIVYLSPGTYLSGTVILKSNVVLYLEAGATLLGSKNIGDFTPQPGTALQGDANQKHLVFARDAENIGIIGSGKIDGQGPAYWVPSGFDFTPDNAWRQSATWKWKALDRPSPMLEFYNCKHLRIEGVRIENAPGWTLRPIQCDDVFIRGISIKNPINGLNSDGIDPTCCRNVFISDCLIDTGDDAICLKSETPYGGELRMTKNITVTNCILSGCCNGFKFGTNTYGGFENIVFSNSVIFNEDVPLNERIVSGIALEMVDGGWVEGVVISNIRMQRARTPIFIRRGNRHGKSPGKLRGIMIDNVYATGAILTSPILGLPGYDVEDVTLTNIRIDSEENGKAEWENLKIPEEPKNYPEANKFGSFPAYGFYCRHVKGLRMRGVDVRGGTQEARPVVVCDDVKNLDIDGLRSAPIVGSQPTVKLIQTRDALLRGCQAPAGTKTFLEVQGENSAHIVLMCSELSATAQVAQIGTEVPTDALKVAENINKV